MMDLYLMNEDGKPVKWDGIKRVTEPICEPSPDDKKIAIKPGDICEFHCKLETDAAAWEQLIEEAEKSSLQAFEILEKAMEICINGDECYGCPLFVAEGDLYHGECRKWLMDNIKKLIDNQRRLYIQFTKDRREKNGKDNEDLII